MRALPCWTTPRCRAFGLLSWGFLLAAGWAQASPGLPTEDDFFGDVPMVLTVSRLGGEEFAVLLPGIEGEEAMRVAERMRVAVEAIELKVGGQRLRFTASFGVANFDGMEVNLPGLLARADAALYQAKHTGRNRVVYADQSVPLFEDTRPAG